MSAKTRERPVALPVGASGGATDVPALAIIAAVAANAVIGAGNRLPWRLPADLKRFRALTTGHAVIMGRKTWESIGRPLPDRQNIVVTRNADFAAPGAEIASTLAGALARVRLPAPAFCIGGGEIYREALAHAGVIYLTEVGRAYAGDATFPEFDRREWQEAEREAHAAAAEDGLPYAFVTYRRRSR